MFSGRQEDHNLLAGVLAGAFGGLVFVAATFEGALPSHISSWGLGPAATLALRALWALFVGAIFGMLFHYQPRAYAAAMSTGLLFGLLAWIAGPLTLAPLLEARSPHWTLEEAVTAFPSLVAHLVYGGVTGLAFHFIAGRLRGGEPSSAGEPVVPPLPKRRILILGGGFAGVTVSRHLEQLFLRDTRVELVLVSKSNYLLFTPLLAEVASGGLLPQHISVPLRSALPRTEVYHGEILGIDPLAREVLVGTSPETAPESLGYDHLVIGLGAVPRFKSVPGVGEHAFTFKTLQDATRLHNHIIAMLELADVESSDEQRRRQLSFVIVGGGFAGTELVAELFDLVHSVLPYYPNIEPRQLRFLLVHAGGRLLPEIGPELAHYAASKLRDRGIEIVLGSRLAAARKTSALLDDGLEVPTRTLVWAAGNRPHPLLQSLPCETSGNGAVVVDESLRVSGLDDVWALGDCARVPDRYRDGQPCPPTAQYAQRQAKCLALNLGRTLSNGPVKPFRYRSLGTLVGLGHRTAVAEVRGFKFSGRLAWLLWRTVYLLKLPGLEKKLRVAIDWSVDLFFPREIVITQREVRERRPQVAAL